MGPAFLLHVSLACLVLLAGGCVQAGKESGWTGEETGTTYGNADSAGDSFEDESDATTGEWELSQYEPMVGELVSGESLKVDLTVESRGSWVDPAMATLVDDDPVSPDVTVPIVARQVLFEGVPQQRGAHRWEVKATDAGGAEVDLAVEFTTNTAPIVALEMPEAAVTGQDTTVRAILHDVDTALVSFDLKVDGVSVVGATATTVLGNGTSYVTITAALDDVTQGVHVVEAMASDGLEEATNSGSFGASVDGDGDGAGEDGDCDDSDGSVYPEAPELCDGKDNDCDGAADEEEPTWCLDGDGDGYGDPAVAAVTCVAPAGYVSACEDCDDGNADTSPSASEACDLVDNNCDGNVNEGMMLSPWYLDVDGDGYGEGTAVEACEQPSGYVEWEGDCDDGNVAVHPTAAEICDGVDNDCQNGIDTDAGDRDWWYQDADNDGYGDSGATVLACDAPSGYVADSTDCNDGDASVSPGDPEVCGGGTRTVTGRRTSRMRRTR